ncbi:chemotaxis protein CheB [Larkinella harenae]
MNRFTVLAIGGSAGSIPVVTVLLEALPANFQCCVIIVLHRLRNVSSSLETVLVNKESGIAVEEPDDKEVLRPGRIYLAPQNYHLLIEADETVSLDYSESVRYSRPSIDVSFESIAQVFAERTVAVLLSGANQDGTAGLKAILDAGGLALVQDPATAEYPAMPQTAIEHNPKAVIMTPQEMASYLKTRIASR